MYKAVSIQVRQLDSNNECARAAHLAILMFTTVRYHIQVHIDASKVSEETRAISMAVGWAATGARGVQSMVHAGFALIDLHCCCTTSNTSMIETYECRLLQYRSI